MILMLFNYEKKLFKILLIVFEMQHAVTPTILFMLDEPMELLTESPLQMTKLEEYAGPEWHVKFADKIYDIYHRHVFIPQVKVMRQSHGFDPTGNVEIPDKYTQQVILFLIVIICFLFFITIIDQTIYSTEKRICNDSYEYLAFLWVKAQKIMIVTMFGNDELYQYII